MSDPVEIVAKSRVTTWKLREGESFPSYKRREATEILAALHRDGWRIVRPAEDEPEVDELYTERWTPGGAA